MKLSEIRLHLAQLQMQPSKSLGQNFLHDQNLAKWMIGQLPIESGDQAVEIGPGLGALTEYLLPKVSKLTVVEKDGRLAAFLAGRFPTESKLQICHEDACEFDIRSLFPEGPTVLIGNLPYYVSTAIILNFLTEPTPVRAALFTLQREVAERLCAVPGTPEYGSLSIALQRRWSVKYLKTLPATVFYPEPKVESAVVLLIAKPPENCEIIDGGAFEKLVRQGFSQRRKQLRKTLCLENDQWLELAKIVDCSTTARAEELSLSQWLKLAKSILYKVDLYAQLPYDEIFDVVDMDDHVIRQSSRSLVHENDWFHRAVHIFLFNRKGELFLQKRSYLKDREPGKWDSSAAGHLDAGEDYDQAASREIVEETGVSTTLHVIGSIPPSSKTGFEFIRLYEGVHEGPFSLQPSEIETGAFFPLSTIRHWTARRPGDFAPGFLECLGILNSLKPDN